MRDFFKTRKMLFGLVGDLFLKIKRPDVRENFLCRKFFDDTVRERENRRKYTLSLISTAKILSHPLRAIESWRSNPTSILLSIYSTPISNSPSLRRERRSLPFGNELREESQDTLILHVSSTFISFISFYSDQHLKFVSIRFILL